MNLAILPLGHLAIVRFSNRQIARSHNRQIEKSATMKTVSGSLKAFLLANRTAHRAQLFTITLLNGVVLRYCDGQSDIKFGGSVFTASSAAMGAWKRGRITTRLGMESSTTELEVTADTTATVNSVPIITAIQLGLFDGATVKVETRLMAN